MSIYKLKILLFALFGFHFVYCQNENKVSFSFEVFKVEIEFGNDGVPVIDNQGAYVCPDDKIHISYDQKKYKFTNRIRMPYGMAMLWATHTIRETETGIVFSIRDLCQSDSNLSNISPPFVLDFNPRDEIGFTSIKSVWFQVKYYPGKRGACE